MHECPRSSRRRAEVHICFTCRHYVATEAIDTSPQARIEVATRHLETYTRLLHERPMGMTRYFQRDGRTKHAYTWIGGSRRHHSSALPQRPTRQAKQMPLPGSFPNPRFRKCQPEGDHSQRYRPTFRHQGCIQSGIVRKILHGTSLPHGSAISSGAVAFRRKSDRRGQKLSRIMLESVGKSHIYCQLQRRRACWRVIRVACPVGLPSDRQNGRASGMVERASRKWHNHTAHFMSYHAIDNRV